MITTKIHAELGQGIFLTKDVAEILELPVKKVSRWLSEFWNNRFGKEFGGYSFGEGHNRAVNFNTLIEFITFANLREHGHSAQKIQKFHTELARTLNTRYPFAETKLLTDKKDIWYERYNQIVKLDGKNQLSLKKIMGPFLNKIDYDTNKVALRYYPLGKRHKVVIDPKHQFGEPTVAGTNIKAFVIYSLYKGNEKKKSICDLYNINLQQVNDAIRYYEDRVAA